MIGILLSILQAVQTFCIRIFFLYTSIFETAGCYKLKRIRTLEYMKSLET